MIDAKLLATYSGDTTLEVFGYWVPRKGDNLRIVAEVPVNFGTDLTVTIYNKNYDETGNGSATSSTASFNEATGRQTIELLGCKELIRVKLGLARGAGLTTSEVGFVMFRFLKPAWFEAVEA